MIEKTAPKGRFFCVLNFVTGKGELSFAPTGEFQLMNVTANNNQKRTGEAGSFLIPIVILGLPRARLKYKLEITSRGRTQDLAYSRNAIKNHKKKPHSSPTLAKFHQKPPFFSNFKAKTLT